MSHSTTNNPLGNWHEQDFAPSISHSNEQQFLNMNPNEELCHNFQEFIQQQSESVKTFFQDEKKITDICARNDMEDSDYLTKELLPAYSAVSSPSDFNWRPNGGGCESLSNESSCESDIFSQYLHQQPQEQQNSSRKCSNFPPPADIEIHDINSLPYSQLDIQQQTSPYDKFQSLGKEHYSDSTPIFSPITPLEHHLNNYGYSLSEACFSPLSSPALQVQSDFPQFLDQRSTLVINSPISDPVDHTRSEKSGMRFKNLDHKPSKSQPRHGFRVKKSPVVNSIRETKGINTFSQSLDKVNLPYSPLTSTETNSYVCMVASNNSISSNISSSMASPPLPPPAITSRSSDKPSESPQSPVYSLYKNYPATPASLMKITQSTRDSIELNPTETNNLILDEPENTVRTVRLNQEQNFEAGINVGVNIPGLEPAAIEKSKGLSKIDNSTIETPADVKPQQGFCRIKDRKSTMGIASPAPLAHFSPNCKPLLPNGARGLKDSASLMLASKSNYQKILDGTPFPGVSYSPELSTNLMSKRTSHKIAEQGRRDRMNSALQEIASLLPRDQTIYDGCEKNEGIERTSSESVRGSSQSANSKARTVEQAIKYINYLKNQLELANTKMEQKQLS